MLSDDVECGGVYDDGRLPMRPAATSFSTSRIARKSLMAAGTGSAPMLDYMGRSMHYV